MKLTDEETQLIMDRRREQSYWQEVKRKQDNCTHPKAYDIGRFGPDEWMRCDDCGKEWTK